MRKVLLVFMSLALIFILSFTVFGFNFTGTWGNIDANTRGITKIQITQAGKTARVHAWGKCHPTDCDWGTVTGYCYAKSVQDPMSNAQAISAIFTTNFSQTILIIRNIAANRIQVESLTRFTDNSNRSNYREVYTLQR